MKFVLSLFFSTSVWQNTKKNTFAHKLQGGQHPNLMCLNQDQQRRQQTRGLERDVLCVNVNTIRKNVSVMT